MSYQCLEAEPKVLHNSTCQLVVALCGATPLSHCSQPAGMFNLEENRKTWMDGKKQLPCIIEPTGISFFANGTSLQN